MSDAPGGERNLAGVLVAGLSVLSSGMQQIFCRSMQQKHGLASHELLANTAPAQARRRRRAPAALGAPVPRPELRGRACLRCLRQAPAAHPVGRVGGNAAKQGTGHEWDCCADSRM